MNNPEIKNIVDLKIDHHKVGHDKTEDFSFLAEDFEGNSVKIYYDGCICDFAIIYKQRSFNSIRIQSLAKHLFYVRNRCQFILKLHNKCNADFIIAECTEERDHCYIYDGLYDLFYKMGLF